MQAAISEQNASLISSSGRQGDDIPAPRLRVPGTNSNHGRRENNLVFDSVMHAEASLVRKATIADLSAVATRDMI